MKFYEFAAKKIDGTEVNMDKYKGKVVLVVNTASKCGFTPQLEGLENLYKEYKDKDFEVLGFPCNQFGGQDPGNNKEISEFCLINYGVTFPMFEKIEVKGENTHPIFKYLKENAKGALGSEIKWNFTKFLINKDGDVVKRYGSMTKPEKLKKDIETLL